MANFNPSDFGKMGMQYANWQTWAGIDDRNPWGTAEQQSKSPSAAVVPPTIDASVSTPDYSVAPISPVTGLGMRPSYGLGTQPSATSTPTTLRDSVRQYFGE